MSTTPTTALPVTQYTPEPALRHPRALAGAMVRDLWRARGLAWRLTVRDLSAQYRQTALGMLWAFIVPLANTLVWVFLGASGVVATTDAPLPYPVYVFTGAMLWAVFVDAANAPLRVTMAAAPMLAQVNFPREALLLSGIAQALYHAGIKLAVLIAALFLLGQTPGAALALAPLGVLALVLAGTVLGLLVTPLGVLYGDVGKSFPLVTQFLMYLTPVVYVMPTDGWAARLLALNPLTPLVSTARAWLTGMEPAALTYFMAVNLVTLALLLVGWTAYRVAMPILIERVRG
ncbi:MAG: ABC transporter permease [Gammaproteobacteria bacterium]